MLQTFSKLRLIGLNFVTNAPDWSSQYNKERGVPSVGGGLQHHAADQSQEQEKGQHQAQPSTLVNAIMFFNNQNIK
jgi:hypothetical protein